MKPAPSIAAKRISASFLGLLFGSKKNALILPCCSEPFSPSPSLLFLLSCSSSSSVSSSSSFAFFSSSFFFFSDALFSFLSSYCGRRKNFSKPLGGLSSFECRSPLLYLKTEFSAAATDRTSSCYRFLTPIYMWIKQYD